MNVTHTSSNYNYDTILKGTYTTAATIIQVQQLLELPYGYSRLMIYCMADKRFVAE